MDFRGLKFKYVEIAENIEGNRNNFVTLSEAEKLVWNYKHKNQAWRSIYTFPVPEHVEYSYSGYYFESDINDFELNRKIIMSAVNHLHVMYEIPLEAFKFKFTNKSIWVEVSPSVMGIRPSKNLNETFKRMTISLNDKLSNMFKIKTPLDTNVYSPRQLVRLTGSFLPKTKRYVVDLNYYEVKNLTYNEILKISQKKRKLTHFLNYEFDEIPEAKSFYKQHIKTEVQLKDDSLLKVVSNEKKCIDNLSQIGVDKGQRNNALFYTAIHLKSEGYSESECFDKLIELNKTFDQHKIDGASKIKATARSVYKSNYRFSCVKMREIYPDDDICTQCPRNIAYNSNIFMLYRNQLLHLFNNTPQKSEFKAVLKKAYGEVKFDKKEIEILKNVPKPKGMFFMIPKEAYEKIMEMGSEITLFFKLLVTSPNGKIVNPKLKVKNLSKHLSLTERSVQRYLSKLEELGFISHGKIEFLPEKEIVKDITAELLISKGSSTTFIIDNKTEKEMTITNDQLINGEIRPEIFKDTG